MSNEEASSRALPSIDQQQQRELLSSEMEESDLPPGRLHAVRGVTRSSSGGSREGGGGAVGATTTTTRTHKSRSSSSNRHYKDGNSSISSVDDIDEDILYDNHAGDLSDCDRSVNSRTKQQRRHTLPAVAERLCEETLDDVHAFSDLAPPPKSAQHSLANSESCQALAKLDEGDDEHDDDSEQEVHVIVTNLSKVARDEHNTAPDNVVAASADATANSQLLARSFEEDDFWKDDDDDDDDSKNLPPGRWRATSRTMMLPRLATSGKKQTRSSSPPGTARKQQHYHDTNSSVSSLDYDIDEDILYDNHAGDLDSASVGSAARQQRKQQQRAKSLPAVTERMCEETLDDVHAFADLAPPPRSAAGAGHASLANSESCQALAKLDECEEEDDDVSHQEDHVIARGAGLSKDAPHQPPQIILTNLAQVALDERQQASSSSLPGMTPAASTTAAVVINPKTLELEESIDDDLLPSDVVGMDVGADASNYTLALSSSAIMGEHDDDDFDEDDVKHLPPGRWHATRVPQRLTGQQLNAASNLQHVLRKKMEATTHTSFNARARSKSPSARRHYYSYDTNSSVSSLEDIDEDILYDRHAVDLDSENSIGGGSSSRRLNKEAFSLPAVAERMCEESLDDVHAFSDVVVTARLASSSNASRATSVGNSDPGGASGLAKLDECEEEDDSDDEQRRATFDAVPPSIVPQVILTNLEKLEQSEQQKDDSPTGASAAAVIAKKGQLLRESSLDDDQFQDAADNFCFVMHSHSSRSMDVVDDVQDASLNLPPGRIHATRVPERLTGQPSNAHSMLRKKIESSHRSRSKSPSARHTYTTYDANSSISSLEDIDQDILYDRQAIDLDSDSSLGGGGGGGGGGNSSSRRRQDAFSLPPVSERMSEESMDDVHAFSDVMVRGTTSSNASRANSVTNAGESCTGLAKLDECEEEEEDSDDDDHVAAVVDDDGEDALLMHHQVILTNMENVARAEQEQLQRGATRGTGESSLVEEAPSAPTA